MNETWDRSDVFDLSPSMYPPDFMWAEEGEYDLEKETAVIEEHYNRAVSVLDGGEGYNTLVGMKDRLEEHHSQAERAADRYESRRNYVHLQAAMVDEKINTIAEERQSDGDEDAVVEERKEVLDEPMGSHFTDGSGAVNTPLDPDEVWSVFPAVSTYRSEEEPPEGNLVIHFRPLNSESWRPPGRINEDHLRKTDEKNFGGDLTWLRALQSLARRLEDLKERYKRAVNTKEMLKFRQSIAETVLYRFEAYGNVEEMTEEDAREAAHGELPDIFDGRPRLREHAGKIVEKYQNEPVSLPDSMTRFKSWIGTDGDNMVSQLQRAIRKADLSKAYRNGDPESFCDLLERLVKRHDAG